MSSRSRFFLLVGISFIVFLVVAIFMWKSPRVNINAKKSIYDCIYSNKYNKYSFVSNNNNFEVALLNHSPKECLNPYFPSIHIKFSGYHTAWIHIINTDDKKYKRFVDTAEDNVIYPFYTLGKDFFDAPLWNYTLFAKSLSFWEGHAYPVIINNDRRKIKYAGGGIAWGYKLSYFKVRPQVIIPRLLTIEDWKKDTEFFSYELPDDIFEN